MATDIDPDAALSPAEFASLYQGALSIDDEDRRIAACFALLSMGRLGLRAEELTHFHEGWIEWASGELRVPTHDPCACRACWQTAQATKQAGDSRSVQQIVTEACWSPQSGNSRSLSFGWSNRLTGVFGVFFEDREYLDADEEAVQQLFVAAASNAPPVQASAVDGATLRASGLEFLATSGFGPAMLADLTSIDAATAREFAQEDGNPEVACGDDPVYPLVCDADQLDGEPFDPADYDPNWRIQRGVQASDVERNPRPTVTPEGASINPESLLEPQDDADETEPDVVAASLADWVEALEGTAADEAGDDESDAETGLTAAAEADAEAAADAPASSASVDAADSIATDESVESVDPTEEVTKPVEFSIDTRFASAAIENGRPTGGSVILGQNELLFLSRDDTGIADFLSVHLEKVVDLAPGYVPDQLAEFFDDTVGIAHLEENDDRKVVVCEVPSDIQWAFINRIFSYILDDIEVVVSGIEAFSGDVEGEEMVLSGDENCLTLVRSDSEREADIAFTRILDVEETSMTHTDRYEWGLLVSHLSTNDVVKETEIRPKSDRTMKLLKRQLVLHRNRKRRKAKEVELGDEHRQVLDALYNTGEGRDLMTILDVDASQFSDVITGLKRHRLVREGPSGVELTATGFLFASDDQGVASM